MTVGIMQVFCYILICEQSRQAVVIDPGGGEVSIVEYIRENNLQLAYIINTHAHPDHTCGNAAIKKATGAAIVMHEADDALLKEREAADYFKRMGFPSSPPADKFVKDGDKLHFGAHTLRIIHTPGHSPGGICLYCEGNLFTGDSLFVGAAGRVDLPGGDFNTLITSLGEKIASLPPETVIWPGHHYGSTPSSTISREKEENPYLGGEW